MSQPGINYTFLCSSVQRDGRRPSSLSDTSNPLRRQRRLRGTGNTVISEDTTSSKSENTYKLGPDDDDEKFCAAKVRPLMTSVLERYLRGRRYENPAEASTLCGILSRAIKDAVKTLGYSRYKIVCNVILGAADQQSVHIASRCLGDGDVDTHASVCYEDGNIYVVAIVHGLYYE